MCELKAEKQRVRRTDASAEKVKVKCERVKPRGQGERLLVVGNLHVRKSTACRPPEGPGSRAISARCKGVTRPGNSFPLRGPSIRRSGRSASEQLKQTPTKA